MVNQSKPESCDDKTSCVGFFAPRTQSAKKYWNKFCWLCHKENPVEKKKCNKCYHVYHVACLEADSICNDCKLAKIRNRLLSSDDQKMLKRLVEKLFCDEGMMTFEKQCISKPLTSIRAKIENYTTFAAFLDDIKWTVHKCMVVYNECQSVEENKMAAMAERLRMYCVEQVESMQACAECHTNSWEWPDHNITMSCKMAHPILWALDQQNLLYWPAKCMLVNDSKVTVRFFGYHKTAAVDVKDCWLYSHQPPSQKNGENQVNADDFSTALKEADAYIENLRKEIGEYVYAAMDTPFNPFIHFRTIGNDAVQSEDYPVVPVPALNRPNLVISSPLIDMSSAHRPNNQPRNSEMPSRVLDMPTIQSNDIDDQQHSSKKTQTKSINSTLAGKKRKITETVATPSPEQKARKSFPATSNIQVFSSLMQLNFREYVDKSSRLCEGIERLENKVAELKFEKKQLIDEIAQQKQEVDKVTNENNKLKGYLKQFNIIWEGKLAEAKRQQWCITCGKKPEDPFYCSKACQKVDWKNDEPEDL
ncbi:MYND-type zinc finger-containing chromatin reader ZMYND8-like [Sitodiplosis mosellana]|uniref:MYND-type zinc finger-containing chromatin reader ZMYND8-like n=1 Tax=Sitodiplosis mosellana TaxID=263140 RepID=UPI002444FD48|nr:MYND-type zinc finger-containing chromatin reader ZMYND8-like [Sitodiplosis mosellana]